ncbi:MAG: TAT-variant-translocated molybdopterin oxidoreductase [Bacteroidetes bacterium]|nr:TAT-variant-translocated molybdopterin oxidoreductase [Bacteroidota bacterium]
MKLWKSIDELAETREGASGEFVDGVTAAPVFDSSVSRRGFMALVSASMALTAAACRRPDQKLVPTVKSHQNFIPGLPQYYASVYSHRNVAYGTLIKSREGRPIKVKGNELHPSNCGTANAEMQASLLSLYDPDRMRRARVNTAPTSYENAISQLTKGVTDAQAAGKNVIVFVDEHCSPSYEALMRDVTTNVPNMSFVTLPAIVCDHQARANKAVLGIDGELVADLGKAEVIVSVGSDFLGTDKLALHHTGRFAARRAPEPGSPTMSKVIVVEAAYTLTGANADVRVALHPSQHDAFLAVLEQNVVSGTLLGSDLAGSADAATTKAAREAAAALKGANGASIVMVGDACSPRAHAIGVNINQALGNIGAGRPLDPACVLPYSGIKAEAIEAAVAAMESGSVHVVVFDNTNPEYSADRRFRAALAKVPVRVACNLYEDETSKKLCAVSLPATHWLESWGDAVCYDGTLSVQQPAIAPLNEGMASFQDTLITVAKRVNPAAFGDAVTSYYDYIMARWNATLTAAGAGERGWSKTLQDGILKPSAPATATATMNIAAGSSLPAGTATKGRVIVTVPSLALYDGKYSNNGWLQELSDPVTKITWDNVALMSAKTAVALGVAASTDAKAVAKANESVITVTTKHGAVDLPVWVQVGMADDVIVTQLGYGKTEGGAVHANVGANTYALAMAGHTTSYQPVEIAVKSGERHRIAVTQNHHTLDDGRGERQIAKQLTLNDVKGGKVEDLHEHFPREDGSKNNNKSKPLSIVSEYEYKGHKWGMVIDMSSCTGCSSCIVACQSENNIPVVGKEQVMKGREMAWIRLDRYYTGDMENPNTVVEPMLCQHCENAPCENVCPVAATTHSPEGLNEMTYNRCVGTRYCSNNCPYKVRRFNFLNYNTDHRTPLDLAFNPEVTVRMRGIMEKCTFCVQRLNEAKWHAKDNGRARVLDGEAVTACQEACPAGAIIFGDMNDPKSRVAKARASERGFTVLEELNVRPSVTYLAKVRNIAGSMAGEAAGHHS